MAIVVRIPHALRDFCGDQSSIEVSESTVGQALVELSEHHPELYRAICDETATLRQHLHLFVNSDWVDGRDGCGLDRQLRSGDVLTIWTAVSGG